MALKSEEIYASSAFVLLRVFVSVEFYCHVFSFSLFFLLMSRGLQFGISSPEPEGAFVYADK